MWEVEKIVNVCVVVDGLAERKAGRKEGGWMDDGTRVEHTFVGRMFQ